MTYSEIMIQAYAEANGITGEEALKRLRLSDLVPPRQKSAVTSLCEKRVQELLGDLRKDSKGVLAWGKKDHQ